jgi:hypothetical protein
MDSSPKNAGGWMMIPKVLLLSKNDEECLSKIKWDLIDGVD